MKLCKVRVWDNGDMTDCAHEVVEGTDRCVKHPRVVGESLDDRLSRGIALAAAADAWEIKSVSEALAAFRAYKESRTPEKFVAEVLAEVDAKSLQLVADLLEQGTEAPYSAYTPGQVGLMKAAVKAAIGLLRRTTGDLIT